MRKFTIVIVFCFGVNAGFFLRQTIQAENRPKTEVEFQKLEFVSPSTGAPQQQKGGGCG